YDNLNRLIAMTSSTGESIVQYEYDALSRRTKRKYPNSTLTAYSYDDNGWLELLENLRILQQQKPSPIEKSGTSVSSKLDKKRWYRLSSPISTFSYNYDKVGNRVNMTRSTSSTNETSTYTYDSIYQLTDVDYPEGWTPNIIHYEYDAVGNCDYIEEDGVQTDYVPNNMNEYDSVGGVTYTYDNNGNLKSDGVWTFTYDYENRLISATDNVTTTNYTYDAFGRRVKKDVDGFITKYIYDGDQVLEELDGTDVVIAKYYYGSGID
ncbi:MAG: hypothetical protein ACFFC7_32845, partial [Candidatus Hermodarchaeota archaeon]